jgi:hypothetical protein
MEAINLPKWYMCTPATGWARIMSGEEAMMHIYYFSSETTLEHYL